MRGLVRLFVVAFTVVTLTVVAAVGVSASSGKFGTSHGADKIAALVSEHLGSFHFDSNSRDTSKNSDKNKQGDKDKDKDKCKEKDHDDDATPGHKHHPCDDADGDND